MQSTGSGIFLNGHSLSLSKTAVDSAASVAVNGVVLSGTNGSPMTILDSESTVLLAAAGTTTVLKDGTQTTFGGRTLSRTDTRVLVDGVVASLGSFEPNLTLTTMLMTDNEGGVPTTDTIQISTSAASTSSSTLEQTQRPDTGRLEPDGKSPSSTADVAIPTTGGIATVTTSSAELQIPSDNMLVAALFVLSMHIL
jgi:hypothetical protein